MYRAGLDINFEYLAFFTKLLGFINVPIKFFSRISLRSIFWIQWSLLSNIHKKLPIFCSVERSDKYQTPDIFIFTYKSCISLFLVLYLCIFAIDYCNKYVMFFFTESNLLFNELISKSRWKKNFKKCIPSVVVLYISIIFILVCNNTLLIYYFVYVSTVFCTFTRCA